MILAADIFVLIGGIFLFLAGLGTLRFRTFAARVHAAAKAGTVGVCSFLVAAAFRTPENVALLVVIMVAVLLTVPAGTHLLMQAVTSSTQVRDRPEPR